MTPVRRTLELTGERLRAYSRRGNFHSDPETARELGLTGLVAQGLQVIGPAYGVLLDEWGEAFLAHGELEAKFVGMVTEDQIVEASVDVDAGAALVRGDGGHARIGGSSWTSEPARRWLGPHAGSELVDSRSSGALTGEVSPRLHRGRTRDARAARMVHVAPKISVSRAARRRGSTRPRRCTPDATRRPPHR